MTPDEPADTDSVTVLDAATRWLSAARLAKRAERTLEARRGDLANVCASLADLHGRPASRANGGRFERETSRVTLEDLTPGDLEAALSDYAASHSSASVRRTLSTWRGFCRWLVGAELLQVNPTDALEGPGRSAWAPKALSLTDVEAVISAAHSEHAGSKDPWPARDAALVAVLVGAGLRSGEVCSLTPNALESVELSPRLRVIGKGSKVRALPIGDEVVVAVSTYLDERAQRLGGDEAAYMFIRRVRGEWRGYNRQALDRVVNRWYRLAGVTHPPGASAHALRHSYATLLVDSGASLVEVQALLGHSDLGTTQAYLNVVGDGLRDAALANPARRALTARPPT